MAKFQDLVGWQFGRLGAFERAENNKDNSAQFWCACVCGKTVRVKSAHLRNGYTRSCGCLRKEINNKKLKDLTGQVRGYFEIIRRAEDGKRKGRGGATRWLCRCIAPKDGGICGTLQEVYANNLITGKVHQCWRCKKRQDSATKSKGRGPLRIARQSITPRGLTQKEFAKRNYCNPRTIYKYEKLGKPLPEGKFQPPPEPPRPSPFDVPDFTSVSTFTPEPREKLRPKKTKPTIAGLARDFVKAEKQRQR